MGQECLGPQEGTKGTKISAPTSLCSGGGDGEQTINIMNTYIGGILLEKLLNSLY